MSEPAVGAVLETAVYCSQSDRERTLRFYGEVLGLRRVAAWEDGTAYRIGAGVLLLFCRERLAGREDPTADHGSTGPGHVCLLAPEGAYAAWRERLLARGVEVTHEHEWSQGLRSFYFRDPAGNLLEIASGDLWPR